MNKTLSIALNSVLALALTAPMFAQATAPAKNATQDVKPAAKVVKPAAAAAPTAQEITDAQAKGLVWVNLNTKVYHAGGDFFGKTKNGKFMTKAEADKAGYKLAQEPKTKAKQKPAVAPAAKK